MAFGTGTNSQKADAGPIRGRQREIGCYCWFTNKGKMIPTTLKVQDEDGEIRTIHQIKVVEKEHGIWYCRDRIDCCLQEGR